MKNLLIFLATLLLIPVSMAVDQQLELLKKQAAQSFDYWPYFTFYTLAPLVVTLAVLGLLRALSLSPRQKRIAGWGYLLLGLLVIVYPLMVILIPALPNLLAQWLYYRDSVRFVGAMLAATGLFQILEGRKNGSETHE